MTFQCETCIYLITYESTGEPPYYVCGKYSQTSGNPVYCEDYEEKEW